MTPAAIVEPSVQPAAYEQPTAAEEPDALEQPSSPTALPPNTGDDSDNDASGGAESTQPATAGLTLDRLHELALSNNPAVRQAYAKVCALRGKRWQAGLPPNPVVGYAGSEIGDGGNAGQQGGYVQQQFITAHKLQRDQAIVSAEIREAEQQVAAAERRVRTDVSARYYEALLAQRRLELTRQLSRVADQAADASRALLEAQEIPVAGLLQSEVQQQNATLLAATARNRLDQAWRELSSVIGTNDMSQQPLAGELTMLPEPLDWDAELTRLRTESPELAAAVAKLQRARRVLNRECVEPRPNITGQLGVQYDSSSHDTIASVQIGLPLPLWNRNQGAICQAKAEITRADRNIDRVELALQQRLAAAFREYADARVTAETYQTEVLPRSEKTFQLVQTGYREGEIGYLALLNAQQTYSQTNLAYLDALGSLWRSKTLIDGLLLEGSLLAEY